MKSRATLALVLFFACALISIFGGTGSRPSADKQERVPPSEHVAIGTITSIDRKLPYSCSIVATEAYHRVSKVAAWARLLHVDGKFPNGTKGGHMITVWQISAGGTVLAYDDFLIHATQELDCHERDPMKIATALAQLVPHLTVSGAHFVQ